MQCLIEGKKKQNYIKKQCIWGGAGEGGVDSGATSFANQKKLK